MWRVIRGGRVEVDGSELVLEEKLRNLSEVHRDDFAMTVAYAS